jgi:hypothetical protein
MSEEPWSDRVAHLTRLAMGCLLLTLNAPLSAQTPPPEPTDSPSAAASTATATPGSTPGAVTLAPRLGPGDEAIAGSGGPTYKLLRYDEDYSYLKDPDRRTDFWDPIKYIPIGDREGWYVSFGAQLRPRRLLAEHHHCSTQAGCGKEVLSISGCHGLSSTRAR